MRKKKGMLYVCSLQADRHELMTAICKIARKAFEISLDDYPHMATSLEKLRRKQLVEMLKIKIDEAASVGWLVIPFDSRDLRNGPGDLDV